MTVEQPVNVVPAESKGAKKKKGKTDGSSQPSSTPVPSDLAIRRGSHDEATNGVEGSHENPYIRELNKNIRNIKKKLNATQKVDSIVAENPGVSLEDLVQSKKINEDQKIQAQKKPSLQASLAQFEEQMSQYKQFDEDYNKRYSTEKAALETSHRDQLQRLKETVTAEAGVTAKKEAKDGLLILSKFLRAAAAKRQAGDEHSAENRAFEGALLLVYGGEDPAVEAMENLISGSEEKVPTVDQMPSDFTYKQVRDSALEHTPYAAEEAWAEEVAQSEPVPPPGEESSLQPATDPTVAHAVQTEIDSQLQPDQANVENHITTPGVPGASNIDASAANAAGGTNWGVSEAASGDADFDGVTQVARDPTETDTGNANTPAAMTGTQSWAEDVPAESAPVLSQPQPTVNGGDGFREVHHNRGGRGRGEFRGNNRGRGGYRGDRDRADGGGGRGGRGGYRGDRGGGEGGHRGRGRGGGYRGGNRGRGGGGGPAAAGAGAVVNVGATGGGSNSGAGTGPDAQ